MSIRCTTCDTDATDSTHKDTDVKKCPDCGTIKFRRLEVTQA